MVHPGLTTQARRPEFGSPETHINTRWVQRPLVILAPEGTDKDSQSKRAKRGSHLTEL